MHTVRFPFRVIRIPTFLEGTDAQREDAQLEASDRWRDLPYEVQDRRLMQREGILSYAAREADRYRQGELRRHEVSDRARC